MLEYIVGGEFFTHLRRAGRFDNDTSRFYSSQIVAIFESASGGSPQLARKSTCNAWYSKTDFDLVKLIFPSLLPSPSVVVAG